MTPDVVSRLRHLWPPTCGLCQTRAVRRDDDWRCEAYGCPREIVTRGGE